MITQGHTYAIGLSQRAGLAEAANVARAQGWALPPAHLAGPIFYGGWSPVVYYPANASPIAPPPDVAWVTEWVVVAYRSGASATVHGYAGEVSPLSVFGPELTFVVDVNAPPAFARSFAGDPSFARAAVADPMAVDPEPEPERYGWVLPWILGGAALTGAWALWGPSKRVRRNPARRPYRVVDARDRSELYTSTSKRAAMDAAKRILGSDRRIPYVEIISPRSRPVQVFPR